MLTAILCGLTHIDCIKPCYFFQETIRLARKSFKYIWEKLQLAIEDQLG